MAERNINYNNTDSNKNDEHRDIELLYHNLQIENATKNTEILKLKEEIQKFRNNIKDSSSNFPLPDEFKTRWETLIRTSAMDALENISLNSILLMKVINIIVKYIYEISITKINHKISEILKCIGLSEKNEENIKNFFEKFKKLIFQDYFNTIFKINEEKFWKKIINNIKNNITSKNNILFSDGEKTKIIKDLNSENFEKFIIELYYLCLYMNINDPRLIIKTSTEINYTYYNKNKYTNLEGFSKENDIWLLILNPPIIKNNNIIYKEIKPVVYLIDNPTKEIKDLCKKQNNINNNKKEISNSLFFNASKYINYSRNNKKINENKKYNLKKLFSSKNLNNYILLNTTNRNESQIFQLKNNKILSNDDFNHKYRTNLNNTTKNTISEKNNISYRSAFLNNNYKKYNKINNTKNNSIIKNIKFKKLNITKNNSFHSLHETHNIPKKINRNKSIEKNNSINKKAKTNKSSTPISLRKSPFFIHKNIKNIKKFINMVNTITKQKNQNYQSEKFMKENKTKLLFNRENKNKNKILKIIDIKKFQEYSSYIRNRNNKIEIKGNKTEFSDTTKRKIKIKNKENRDNSKNKSSIKESIYPKAKARKKIIESKSENEKKNKNIFIKTSNVLAFTNKIYKSEPNVDAVRPIKKGIKIPNTKINNNTKQKEEYASNKNFNVQNKNINSVSSFYKKNNNLIINTNSYYKTGNNSLLSNYNYENSYTYASNNSKYIQQNKNREKKEFKKNNSLSTTKIENTNNYLSSKDIRMKRKNRIFNINKSTNNKTEKKNQRIIKRNNNKNKCNSNFHLYDKKINKDISYYSIISSNSQINLHANKNLYKNKIKNKNEDQKTLQNTCILLYKTKINEINTYNIKNIKENINQKNLNLNLYTEKNQDKNVIMNSLRSSFKGGKDAKSKKIENKNDINKEKRYNNFIKKLNYKLVSNLLSENKENKNLNIKEKKKNNIDKNEGNNTNCIRKKSKDAIDNNIKY